MGGASPEDRLIETVNGGPTPDRHDLALLVIPLVYALATMLALVAGLRLFLVVGGVSVLAYGMIVATLFLYPP